MIIERDYQSKQYVAFQRIKKTEGSNLVGVIVEDSSIRSALDYIADKVSKHEFSISNEGVAA